MGILSLDRRVAAEVLDGQGGLVIFSGATRIGARLRRPPIFFVKDITLEIVLQVGVDRFTAACRVVDNEVVACLPGARVELDVLNAAAEKPEPPPLIVTQEMIAGPFDRVFETLQEPAPTPPNDEDEEPTGVVGSLKEMPVAEIVQALTQSHKDALIEVKPKGKDQGTICVESGRVMYAATSTARGEEAFYELLAAARGSFRIRYGRHAPSTNIDRDATYLLLEAARRMDEDSVQVERPKEPHSMARHSTGTFASFYKEAGVAPAASDEHDPLESATL